VVSYYHHKHHKKRRKALFYLGLTTIKNHANATLVSSQSVVGPQLI